MFRRRGYPATATLSPSDLPRVPKGPAPGAVERQRDMATDQRNDAAVTTERFEWAYRWLDADGNVLDEMDTRSLSFETAEERAHRLAANRPASVPGGAVVRYRVVTTEEVVATYPEVKP